MKHTILIVGGCAILALFLVLGGITIGGYNSLVKEDETTSTNYAQVQNLLKARHDKITEMMDTLQGAISEEQAIYDAIATCRSSYKGENATSDASEATAFNDLVAIVEDNEPTFLTGDLFRGVMDEISEAENKLEVGRKDYNDSVRTYNASIRMFPTNIFANMFGFTSPKDYWAISQSDTEMPVISFSFSAEASKSASFAFL